MTEYDIVRVVTIGVVTVIGAALGLLLNIYGSEKNKKSYLLWAFALFPVGVLAVDAGNKTISDALQLRETKRFMDAQIESVERINKKEEEIRSKINTLNISIDQLSVSAERLKTNIDNANDQLSKIPDTVRSAINPLVETMSIYRKAFAAFSKDSSLALKQISKSTSASYDIELCNKYLDKVKIDNSYFHEDGDCYDDSYRKAILKAKSQADAGDEAAAYSTKTAADVALLQKRFPAVPPGFGKKKQAE